MPWGGPAVAPIHAASGVGYGLGFAGNTHRHVPDGWVPAVKFLVEELGADVNARDHNGYTPLHHAAVARRQRPDSLPRLEGRRSRRPWRAAARRRWTWRTVRCSASSRIPETIALLESLGAMNNHRCVSC